LLFTPQQILVVSEQTFSTRRILARESALLLSLLLAGMVVLPAAIFLVGQVVFGTYGDGGFADFYSNLHAELRSGDIVVWYLILSPYIAWQLLRLTRWGFRRGRRTK
jgi:hypothetical protein